MVICEKCGKEVFAVFRDRPKGLIPKWLCYSCLPNEEMKREARETMDDLADPDAKIHVTG